MNEQDRQICRKILSEIAITRDLLAGFHLADFMRDERTARAVCMTLINIGELVKSLTLEFRDAHREIPWRAIAGMRDITAHKYQTLRKEDVFDTCETDLPVFEEQLRKVMDEGPMGKSV